jgi:hypothetical protein
MRGALDNVCTLVCFGLDRSDTKLQAKRIFLAHGENIKQEAMTDKQYPIYYPLYEDIEKYIQELDKIKSLSAQNYGRLFKDVMKETRAR